MLVIMDILYNYKLINNNETHTDMVIKNYDIPQITA